MLLLFLANAVVGGFLIAGARKMKRLEAYEFSVLSSLMAGLQVTTPTFPVSVIIGGWAFWVLRKPEVKAAFAHHLRQTYGRPPQARSLPADPGAPEHRPFRADELDIPPTVRAPGVAEVPQPVGGSPRARVRGPARLLLLTGIGYTLLTVGSALALMFNATGGSFFPRGIAPHPLVIVLLIVQGPIIIVGALNMRNLTSRAWAVTGAVLAIVPTTPLAVIGLPIGVWVLTVLSRTEVKAAFGRRLG
jgi:hypothetical protein